ncbi:MAG: hypothetical protein IJ167_05265 [Lachnospiraceae bacterium]|nr:hypothetical protein [Lachnospiraceae bacterium]
MAIGYRLTADELTALCWLTNNKTFKMLNINYDFSLGKFDAVYEKIIKKKLIHENAEGYILDPVINYIMNILTASRYYMFDLNGCNVIINGGDSVLFMHRDGVTSDIWHIFPYEKLIDVLMDDKQFCEDEDYIYLYDAYKDENTECKWNYYCERMMQNEQGID